MSEVLCVAVCCSVLQRVAVCCSVSLYCSVLQCENKPREMSQETSLETLHTSTGKLIRYLSGQS